MNKTVTAERAFIGGTVRVSIPESHIRETTAGHREVEPGIVRIGYHIGRRWGVVHNYDLWTKDDGTVYGDEYTAYDLTDEIDSGRFYGIVNASHYSDLTTGRSKYDL